MSERHAAQRDDPPSREVQGRSAPTALLTTVSFLLTVAFFGEVLGYFTRAFNTFLGAVFLVLFLQRQLPWGVIGKPQKKWLGLLLLAFSLIGVFHWTGWVRVLLLSLLVAGVGLLRRERGHSDVRAYQLTALAYGLFLWFWQETATGWYVLDGAARGLTWLAQHAGLNISVGPTAAGIPAIVLLLLYGVVRAHASPGHRLRAVLALAASLLVVQLAFIALQVGAGAAISMNLMFRQGASGSVSWSPFAFLSYAYPNGLHGIAFLLGLVPTLIITRTPGLEDDKVSPGGSGRWVLVAGAAALFVGSAIYGLVPPKAPAAGEILLHDAGYLNWQMPVFGSYGDKSGGMFGRLPQFLDASGYRVKRRPVSRATLRSADALVLINVLEKFDQPTKKAIWDFVRRGGGLLVLGDHTGVQGIREPFNDLLEPVGIAFNFDSAKAFRDGWPYAYSLPRHPATLGVDDTINELEIWVGASLTAKPPARPVIIGRYAFSDPGDLRNAQRGYLGNLAYDQGERLNDVVLVAECRIGKGKVLVFGDTSPFQNGALVYSHKFVERVLAWLAQPEAAWLYLAKRLTAGLLVLAGLFMLAARGSWRLWPAVAAAAFLLGWAAGAFPARALDAPSRAQDDIAWIDMSHLERFSLNGWVDDGFGGLTYNLMRNDYSPLLMIHWDPQALRRGKLLFLIGPSRPFSRSEIKAVRQFVLDGGHLILAAGYEDLYGSSELWEEFGLQVEQMPLGRVLVKQPGGDVRLYKGWPIKATRGDPKVLCSPWGYPAIVRQRLGKGSVVAIADTQFLLDRNLEGRERYYPENVAFLRKLFTELKKN